MTARTGFSRVLPRFVLFSAAMALVGGLAGGCGEDDLTFPGAETATPAATVTVTVTVTPTPIPAA